jgi:hypothetical protein
LVAVTFTGFSPVFGVSRSIVLIGVTLVLRLKLQTVCKCGAFSALSERESH